MDSIATVSHARFFVSEISFSTVSQDRMLAKLAARRRKQEQQELNERKKRQEEEIHMAQQMERERFEKEPPVTVAKEVPVVDEAGAPVLLSDGSVKMELIYESVSHGTEASPSEILAKQGIMHQLIADNPAVLESLQTLAAEHLGIAADELKQMNADEVHMLLVEKGVDVNILEYLKNLTNEEAAKYLAREMARAEAEAKMLRKVSAWHASCESINVIRSVLWSCVSHSVAVHVVPLFTCSC
jgi:hypothetical protein